MKKGTWKFKAFQNEDGYWLVHEYYGKKLGRTVNSVEPYGETLEELSSILEMMSNDIKKQMEKKKSKSKSKKKD